MTKCTSEWKKQNNESSFGGNTENVFSTINQEVIFPLKTNTESVKDEPFQGVVCYKMEHSYQVG